MRRRSRSRRCEAVRAGAIEIVPKSWEKTYFNWMENIQPWCVSRQLWWGHRIPAWYRPDGRRQACFRRGNRGRRSAGACSAAKPLEQRDEDVARHLVLTSSAVALRRRWAGRKIAILCGAVTTESSREDLVRRGAAGPSPTPGCPTDRALWPATTPTTSSSPASTSCSSGMPAWRCRDPLHEGSAVEAALPPRPGARARTGRRCPSPRAMWSIRSA